MLEISPADDYAHYALGRALEKQGKVREANGHYKLARTMKPGDEHYASRVLDLRLNGRVRNGIVGRCEPSVSGCRGHASRPAARSAAGCASSWVSRARDDAAEAERLAGKVARLRIFENEDGKFDRSLLDVGGAALVVSPVHAHRRHRQGEQARASPTRRRPSGRSRSTSASARSCARSASPVETGVFGARMAVELVNDGPVTIVLDL